MDINTELTDKINKAKIDGLKKMLEPFADEIQKHNGEVIATIKSDKLSVEFKGIPQELNDRIIAALG